MRRFRRGLRARLLVLGLVCLALGHGSQSLYHAVRFRLTCDNPPFVATSACSSSTVRQAARAGLAAVVIVALVAILLALILWALRPLRQLVPTVDRVGPQNMTERVDLDASPRDELTRLAQAVNSSLDRLSAGYEGQRRFAANASHELRTPLAVQRALIEVGMARALTTEQLQLLACRAMIRTCGWSSAW